MNPHYADSTAGASFGRWSYRYATDSWWWSPELLELTGVSQPPSGLEEYVEHMSVVDEREEVLGLVRGAIESRSSFAGQFSVDTPHGTRIFALVADTVFDGEGAPVELRGYSTDVTEDVRQATRAAVDAATRHRRAIEQVKGALMVVYRMDEVTAFALLRQQSNAHNVKLNVLAEHVSRAMASGPVGREVPLMQLLSGVAKRLATGNDDLPPSPQRVAT